MNDPEGFEPQDTKHLQLLIYLLPVFGFFPSLWTLYRRKGTRLEQRLSRLSVTLAVGWLISYVLLGSGAQMSEPMAVPLLLTNSLLTSGYFLTCLWLMYRLWQQKSLWLPGVSRLSDRLP